MAKEPRSIVISNGQMESDTQSWLLHSEHPCIDNNVFDVGIIPCFLQNVLDISVDAEEWSRIGCDLGMGKLITSITTLNIDCVWACGFGHVNVLQ